MIVLWNKQYRVALYLVNMIFLVQMCTPFIAYATKTLVDIPADSISIEALEAKPSTYFIKEIHLENPRFITKRVRRKLINPYTNIYIDNNQLKRLVQGLSAFYMEKGYPTMQIKVNLGQNLQAGILKLVIVDGFIEDIQINKPHNKHNSGMLATAFPGLKGKLLYLPHLEQGIDQMNAVSSSNATMRILPGKQEGGSIIQINHTVNKPFRVDLGMDNLGEEEPGKWQGKVNIGLDNLLRINDHWIINYSTNKAKKIAGKKFIHYSWMIHGNFHIGYYTLAANYSFKYSLKPRAPEPQAANPKVYFQLSKNYMHSYELKRIIYKTRTHKNLWIVGFEYRTSQNYIKNQLIGVQSVPYTCIKLGTNHTGLLLNGQYVFNITYQQGVEWLAEKKHLQSKEPDSINALFKKLEMHTLWLKPFYFGQLAASYQVDLNAQYSQHQLPGFAQFSLAEFSQVRGFKKHYTGNRGLICKQELACLNLFPKVVWLHPLQLIAALDIGYLPKVSNDPKIDNQSLTLASWIGGCRYNKSWISIECLYAKPFYNTRKLADNSYTCYFNLSIKLHNLFLISKIY